MSFLNPKMKIPRPNPFSFHALQRLGQRTNLTCDDVMQLIDQNRFVNLGTKPGVHRRHLLLYSISDELHFVVIQDSFDGTLITILPLEYHERLAWNVSEDQLVAAKSVAERPPEHKLSSPPQPKTLYVAAYYSDEYGCPKQTTFAKLQVEIHGSEMQDLLADEFTLKTIIRNALRKGLDPNTIESISIRAGKKGPTAVFNLAGHTAIAALWADSARELSPARPELARTAREPEPAHIYVGCRFQVSNTQNGVKSLGRVPSANYGNSLRQLLADEGFFAWVIQKALSNQILPDSINGIFLRLNKRGERFFVEIDDLTPSGVAFVRSE